MTPAQTDPKGAVTLEDLLVELQAIRRALEQPARPAMSRDDSRLLASLLPLVRSVVGAEPFTSRELTDDDAAPQIRQALTGVSVKGVGRLLARAEGHEVAGHVVRREGSELRVSLWRIERARFPVVRNPEKPPTASRAAVK